MVEHELVPYIRTQDGYRVATSGDTAERFYLVKQSPADLAGRAGVSVDIYALASMIRSEHGGDPLPYRRAVGEVARNVARARGQGAAGLLTASTWGPPFRGAFGEQVAGRWASTRKAPRPAEIDLAREILSGASSTVGTADDFFSPRVQDLGVQGGHRLRQDAQGYIKARAAEGRAWIGPIQGIDPYELMVFGRDQAGRDQRREESLRIVQERGRFTRAVAGAREVAGDHPLATMAVATAVAVGLLILAWR